jgi:hypothetical protein
MFFSLLILSVPDVTPGCFSIFWLCKVRSKSKDRKTSWSNIRYSQSQKTEKHPGVTSGTLNLIFWLWDYLMLLQDVFKFFDFERTWRYSRMFLNFLTLSVPDVILGCFSLIEKHPGVTSGTLKVKRLKSILE